MMSFDFQKATAWLEEAVAGPDAARTIRPALLNVVEASTSCHRRVRRPQQ